MKAVTLTAPTYQELKAIYLVRKLYVPNDVTLKPTQYSELCKRFSKGYEKLKDNPDTIQVMKQVNKYIKELLLIGVSDHEVKAINFSYYWLVRKSVSSFIKFHIFLLISLPAIIIISPFAYIVQKKAEKDRQIVILNLNKG